MKIFIFFSFLTASVALLFAHPVILMVLILLQAMNSCMLIWAISSSSWLSYTLFLIFVGGLMVLFIYITSLAANEKTNLLMLTLTKNSNLLIFITTFVIVISLFFPSNSALPNNTTPHQLEPAFSPMVSPLTMMTMIYLLLTLIVVVKLASKTKGPLRNTLKPE